MKKWLLWLGGGVLAVVLAVGAYLVVSGNGAAIAGLRMAVRTENAYKTADLPSPLVGKPAPAIALPLVGGGKASLQQYRGKTVLVTFWSTF